MLIDRKLIKKNGIQSTYDNNIYVFYNICTIIFSGSK